MATITSSSRWRYVPCGSTRRAGCESVVLSVEDPQGSAAAVARVDIPGGRGGRGQLSLRLGPRRPPAEVVGRLVHLVAAMATDRGARSLHVRFAPRCTYSAEVLASSGLDWTVHAGTDVSTADASIERRPEAPSERRSEAAAAARTSG